MFLGGLWALACRLLDCDTQLRTRKINLWLLACGSSKEQVCGELSVQCPKRVSNWMEIEMHRDFIMTGRSLMASYVQVIADFYSPSARIKAAAFWAVAYSIGIGCDVSSKGMTPASTSRNLCVPYTLLGLFPPSAQGEKTNRAVSHTMKGQLTAILNLLRLPAPEAA